MNILTSSHSRETFNIISSEICVKGEVNDMEDKNEMGKKNTLMCLENIQGSYKHVHVKPNFYAFFFFSSGNEL